MLYESYGCLEVLKGVDVEDAENNELARVCHLLELLLGGKIPAIPCLDNSFLCGK